MASELLVLTESKEISTRSTPQGRHWFNEHSLWSTNNQPAFELIAQCYSYQGKYTCPWAHGGNWTQQISTSCLAVSHEYTGQDRARNSCCPSSAGLVQSLNIKWSLALWEFNLWHAVVSYSPTVCERPALRSSAFVYLAFVILDQFCSLC